MKEFYHVSVKDNEKAITSEGLVATEASECDSGKGIHVAESVMGAHAWLGQLRNEREIFDKTFTIFQVRVEDNVCCRKDEFEGVGPDDSYVLCTDSIRPENLEAVEWVY